MSSFFRFQINDFFALFATNQSNIEYKWQNI